MAKDRSPGIDKRNRRVPVGPAPSDWLARRGGWVLTAAGVALIALAAVVADKAAVAPIFAIGGVALLVVGVMLPRIQGQFEFSATGFKLDLAELAEQTYDLDLEAKGEVLERIIETASTGEGVASAEDLQRLPSRLAQWVRLERRVEEAFVGWLERDGWKVQTHVVIGGPQSRGIQRHLDRLSMREVDVIAERGNERLVAEVVIDAQELGALINKVERIRGLPFDWSDDVAVRFAVVFEEPPPAEAVKTLRDQGFEVYSQGVDGFELLA